MRLMCQVFLNYTFLFIKTNVTEKQMVRHRRMNETQEIGECLLVNSTLHSVALIY